MAPLGLCVRSEVPLQQVSRVSKGAAGPSQAGVEPAVWEAARSCRAGVGQEADEAAPGAEKLRKELVYLMAACGMPREGPSVPVHVPDFWLEAEAAFVLEMLRKECT